MHLEVSRVPFAEKQALRDNVYLILLTHKKKLSLAIPTHNLHHQYTIIS
jgi:hypothetical protein